MTRWIVDTSLRFRRLIIAVAAGLIVVGVVQVGNRPVSALPEYSPPTVEVQTEALGLSAEEVEQLITVPLEQDLLVGVAFLDEIESVSLPGLSSVVMTFQPGTDLLDARQVVQERLTQAVGVAGLPEVSKPPQMIQPLSSESRVSMVKLSSDSLSQIEVSVLARWVIGPRLMGVPGVANVAIWGNRDRQLQVLVDPERLKAKGTSLSDVIRTAGNALEVSPLSFLEASSPGTGGFIDTPNQRLNIFHEQAISSPSELAQVPMEGARGAGGNPLTLGDVTEVVESNQPLIGDAVCSGGEDCLLMVVEKFPEANTVEVADGVEAALAALQPGMEDVRMEPSVYRPADFVGSAVFDIGWALLGGAVLLLLVLGGLLWSWRRSMMCIAAVTASTAAAVVVLYLRDTTVNLMVVTGLVVALTAVVADAVGDVQTMAERVRRQQRAHPGVSTWQTLVAASTELRRSASYAIFIVAAAALPLFFLINEGSAFLPPVAVSYLLAVAASMLVALTLIPALGYMLLTAKSAGHPEAPASRALHRWYDAVAPRLVTRTGTALLVCAGVVIAGLAATPFLDMSMRPALNERDVLVRLQAPPGTSLPRMTEVTRETVDDVATLPGVADATGEVGRAVMSDATVNVNSGAVWVNLDDSADYDATVASIRDAAAGQGDVSTSVTTYSAERVQEVLGGPEHDAVVRIYGESRQILESKAAELRALIGNVEGVARAQVDRAPDEQTLRVEVDLDQAQAFGITPGEVRRTAATLMGGITVGHLFDQQKVFDVVVWGAPEIRDQASDVANLMVDTPNGGQVRIGDVATVATVPQPTEIRHESVASYLDVTADVSGRDVGDVVDDIDELVDRVSFPLEHHAELLAFHDERQSDLLLLGAMALSALLAIFLLMQAAFGSWRLAGVGLLLLPIAGAGGLVAALLTGRTVSIGTVAGLLGVVGIGARGIVTLVRRFRQMERDEGQAFGTDLVISGTREMFVPTLVTALATAAAMLPLVILAGTGSELLRPMAAVILGGLVTTTLVVLFVVPVLYLRIGRDVGEDVWTDDLFRIPQQRQAPERETVGDRILQRRIFQRRGWTVTIVGAVLAPLALSGCAGAVSADAYTVEGQPAHLEPVPGTHDVRVVLTARAAERIRLDTDVIRKSGSGLVVPRSAIFVDTAGVWWVYTNPNPLVFLREEVELVREQGGKALLSDGPPAGTRVVTTGVPELYGVEESIDH